jgi:hypothetical protein
LLGERSLARALRFAESLDLERECVDRLLEVRDLGIDGGANRWLSATAARHRAPCDVKERAGEEQQEMHVGVDALSHKLREQSA